ncbi:MAG: hypothetical protein NTV46_21740, partial [Verrucomicrobia bacterium]|nr:hypothetical protein [Verrucomicrobiota bacterium]
IFYATWLVATTGGPLWRVKDVRFDELRKSQTARMTRDLGMLSRESGMAHDPSRNNAAESSLEDYIKDKTQRGLIHVEGHGWRTFFDTSGGVIIKRRNYDDSGPETRSERSNLAK